MMDKQSLLAANPINRYGVGKLPGLAANADGSIDIHIQKAAPAGHETNWLPAPVLMLRAYQTGPSVLIGE
jgi:hypothetical protein